jgi:predicted methyltransferase
VKSHLDVAKDHVAEALRPGDRAVDATAGNGHDTAFLAEAVGTAGGVWAFDVQPQALDATRRRLEANGVADRVTLVQRGHERMREALPPEAVEGVRAVMFNLGYLPGSDKTCTTEPETTLPALDAAAALLAEGGVLTVVCYPGHPGGAEETAAVRRWAEQLAPERFGVFGYRFLNQNNDPPRVVIVERRKM